MDSQLAFTRLTEDSLDTAVALCDKCVGKNLYSRTYLASVINDPTHYFYFLVTAEQETAGYIYFFLTNIEAVSAYTKLPREQLAVVSDKKNPVIGNLQSIGVVDMCRGRRLSEELVRFYLEQLQTQSAVDAAFGVFWKVGGSAPMEKTLKTFDFIYLTDARRVWYDNKDLICHCCEGVCVCDAAVYYKKVERRL